MTTQNQPTMTNKEWADVLEVWVENFRQNNQETYPCRHGHLNCSTYPGGRCLDETLHQIDALRAKEI